MWGLTSSSPSNIPAISSTATNLLHQALNFYLINIVLFQFCCSFNSNIYWIHSPLGISEYPSNTETKQVILCFEIAAFQFEFVILCAYCYFPYNVSRFLIILSYLWWITYELHVLFYSHHFRAGPGSILQLQYKVNCLQPTRDYLNLNSWTSEGSMNLYRIKNVIRF
jgi:hypothetical protein